jgi:PRC-barrel domain
MPGTGDDERGWQGRQLIDGDGDAVGLIRSVDVDDAGEPAWARVETGGRGAPTRVVPLTAASVHGPVVRVPYDRALILAAPAVHGRLSGDDQAMLAEHYGLRPASTERDEPRADATDIGDRDWDDRPGRNATGDVGDIGDF